jgi:hypothetical protein
MERTTGLEPVISGLARRRSTRPELRPHGSGPRTRTSILGFKGRAPTVRDEPGKLARGDGFEPPPPGSEPGHLPLVRPPSDDWRPRRESNSSLPARQAGVHASGPRGRATIVASPIRLTRCRQKQRAWRPARPFEAGFGASELSLPAPVLHRPEGLGTFTVPGRHEIAHLGDARLVGERDGFGPHCNVIVPHRGGSSIPHVAQMTGFMPRAACGSC